MTYRISGIALARFQPLFGRSDAELALKGAIRVRADQKPGFPCRVTLEDAEPGETLLLLNYEHQDADTPYRSTNAIYVREAARQPAELVNALPPVFAHRRLSLRGFDDAGMLRGAILAEEGEADAQIRALLARDEIAYIHAHNAAYGCFAARIDRA